MCGQRVAARIRHSALVWVASAYPESMHCIQIIEYTLARPPSSMLVFALLVFALPRPFTHHNHNEQGSTHRKQNCLDRDVLTLQSVVAVGNALGCSVGKPAPGVLCMAT